MKTTYFLLAMTAAVSVAACKPANTSGTQTQAANEAESTNAAGPVDNGAAPAANQANAAAQTAAAGSLVPFRGCPIRSGSENGCITVKSDNGVTYELYSDKSLPDPSQYLIVVGKGTPGAATICQAGKALTNVEWTYTKMKCG